MKKLLVVLLLLLSFAGCQKKEETKPLLDQIKEKGYLTVAMEGTWSPWTYHDLETDELMGYDVEVAKAIAEYLGVEVRFEEGEWDGLFVGFESGLYDIIVNGVDVTEERSKKYDFTEPYAYIKTAIMVKGDRTDINSFEDLAGKKTGNTITSVYAQIAASYGAEVTAVDDLNQTFLLLLQDRIDATLNAEDTFADYMNAHPEVDVKIAALTAEANSIAIPVRKGEENASFLKAVNEAIAHLKENGKLAEISNKYFGKNVSEK